MFKELATNYTVSGDIFELKTNEKLQTRIAKISAKFVNCRVVKCI